MALDSLIRVITRVLFSAIEDRIDRYSPGVVLDYDGEGRAGPAKNRAGKKQGRQKTWTLALLWSQAGPGLSGRPSDPPTYCLFQDS